MSRHNVGNGHHCLNEPEAKRYKSGHCLAFVTKYVVQICCKL